MEPPVARDVEEGAQAGGGQVAAIGFVLGFYGVCWVCIVPYMPGLE